MSFQKNILIVDDDPRLRNQLVRLVQESIADWNIIEASNYDDAIKNIENYQIKILVSDLYLFSDEERTSNKNDIPSGIKVADYLRKKQSDSTIYIVSSNINTLVSQNQLSEYISVGVTQFLDRNVDPYEKFSKLFQYQLKAIDKSIVNSEVFVDNKGSLVIKTEHEAFIGIPVDKRKIISATLAKKSISERTAIFVSKESQNIALRAENSFSPVTKFTSIDTLLGISKSSKQNFKVISRLSSNDFFAELSKELYRNRYTYMRFESKNIHDKQEFVVYAIMLMKSISGYEDAYCLSIPSNISKKLWKLFNDIINNFKESQDWSIYPIHSGILSYDKPSSYLLIAKEEDQDAEKILASVSLISTLQ